MGGDPTLAKQGGSLSKKALSPRLAKLEEDFLASGGEWKKYAIGELFNIQSSKKIFHAQNLTIFEKECDNTYPYVVRSTVNNGIRGYISESTDYLNPGKTLSFAQDTFTVFYQEKPYFTGNKVKVLTFKFGELTRQLAIAFVAAFRKSLANFTWGIGSTVDSISEFKLELPTDKFGKVDFSYMENYIKTLEAYLTVTGLRDYHLSEKDEKILDKFTQLLDTESRVEEWGTYNISSLFTKLQLQCLKKDFDKVRDTSSRQTSEFNLPLVNAKIGNNGIMFYGREADFESAEMAIDIISNGAVATGTVYPQIKRVGVLWDAYLIRSNTPVDRAGLLFLATSLEKAIKQRFGWENKAVWSKVRNETINLPTQNNQPDYAFMSDLIRVIEKLVIKDLVLWTDKRIEATKEIVGS